MRAVLLALALALGGCTRAQLLVANVPDWFAPGERTAVPHAPEHGLALDVYRPAAAAPRPVIVFVHGGSWQSGSRRQYAFVGRALARAGYVAVLPDYRKYPDVRFPAFVGDVAAATAWALRNAAAFGGDPGSVFLMGHSAGAHLAMLVALDARYLRAEGVDPALVRGVIGLAGPYDFALDSATLRSIFAGAGDGTVPDYRPMAWVRPGAPPALLVHGTADTDVRPRNSERLAEALQAAGVPVTLELLPGLGHGAPMAALSSLRRDVAPVLDMIVAFTAAHGADVRSGTAAPATAPAL